MSNMMETGMAWLNAQRRSHLSTVIQYRRDAATAEVLATFGNTIYEVVDDTGKAVKSKGVDFIVSVSDLVDAGFGEPLEGDKIDILSGDDAGKVYEVLMLAGDNPYRPHDPHGNAVRIHTKLIGPCEV